MHRSSWILVLVGLAVMAVALYVWRNAPGQSPMARQEAPVVRTYPVPADRGEEIRDALRGVLQVRAGQGGLVLGQATLPLPNRLVVSAPESMHASIEESIAALAGGSATSAQVERAVAIDIWVVGVQPAIGEDDPALAIAAPALQQARTTFGFGSYRLIDRATVVGVAHGGALDVNTPTLNASIRLDTTDANTVSATLNIALRKRGGAPMESHFGSRLPLREGEWQVVGLLRDAASDVADTPDVLLLVRQTAVGTPTAAP